MKDKAGTLRLHEEHLPDYSYLAVPFITLLAFFIKGATGFGTALVMVPISTVIVGAHHAIVVSSILDTIGGSILFLRNPLHDSRRFWIPMAAGMVAGSVVGGVVLSFVPVGGFRLFLGLVVIVLGLWFVTGRGGGSKRALPSTPPRTASAGDVAVAAFAGFCGGLFGISGPPIIYYLGNRLAKSAFRSTLVAVFLFGGIARITTYAATGIMDTGSLYLSTASLPGLLLGLYLGNHLFVRVDEVWFGRLIGVVLMASALKLIL